MMFPRTPSECIPTTYFDAITDSEAWKQIGQLAMMLPFLLMVAFGYTALIWIISLKFRPTRLTVNMLIWMCGIVAASLNGNTLIHMFMENDMDKVDVKEALLNLLAFALVHAFLITYVMTSYQRKSYQLTVSPEERLGSVIIVILSATTCLLFVVTWHVFQQKAPLGCVPNLKFILNQMMMLLVLIQHVLGVWFVGKFIKVLLAKDFVVSTLDRDNGEETKTTLSLGPMKFDGKSKINGEEMNEKNLNYYA